MGRFKMSAFAITEQCSLRGVGSDFNQDVEMNLQMLIYISGALT
jgi:hypothetical protein